MKGPLVRLREYVVLLRREQFTEVYVVTTDPDSAADAAKVRVEADELDWDDGDTFIENIEEA